MLKICALIVEDEAFIAHFLEDVLGDLGVGQIILKKRKEAPPFIIQEGESIHIAIVDVSLNTAIDQLNMMHLSMKHIPTLVISTNKNVSLNVALDNQPHVHLTKPFGDEEVRVAISELMLRFSEASG